MQVAIDSNVDADLMDVDKSAAIMSRTPGMEGNALLATYRCQDNHNRLEIKMRTIEVGGTAVPVAAAVS